MQDFVGIRVADAAEEMRIGERSLESVVFTAERVLECGEVDGEDLEAAGILLCQRFETLKQVQRRPPLAPRLG